ncbi:DEAD/DEAH box helicase [Candidatus Marsarchaeota archaeon]|jgi:superfamily II DNA/RNA helicase|nr:DEAD/DEAH box helicase [Candidatus Marsarchaeota archaeon]
MEGFEKLSLRKEIMDALKEMGFNEPTDVQSKTIPVVLEGKDVVVRSKTGSGKTAAFLIPILQSMQHDSRGVQALVIAPTRELAVQIEGVARKMTKFIGIRTTVVYGGVSIVPQAERIRNGAKLVVGTPGRIIDLMERGQLSVASLRFLVLDEADIMLDMGFIDDIRYILDKTPPKKQTMLFSATMPAKIVEMAREYLNEGVNVGVGEEENLAVTSIENLYTVVEASYKFSMLLAYLDQYKPAKSVVFVRTQRSADIVYRIVRAQGFNPVLLHGGITQARREVAMSAFRKNQSGMLIATNVAARGIDITDISDIINFDAPDDPTVYIHRIGRSARMGRNGRAFTIFNRDQHGLIGAIERFAGVQLRKIVLDNRKFSNINYGEHIRASVGYRERGPRRWEERGHDEHRQGHGGYGRGHQRHGRFRPQHQRRSY